MVSKSRNRWIFWGFVALFAIDQISKLLTHRFIPLMTESSSLYPYGGIGVFKNFLGIEFSISHATNKGAAWGFFANAHHYLLAFRILFIVGLIAYCIFGGKNRAVQMPLLLVMTGAIGNVVDFFVYGHVVDMLHFVFWGYDYPVFNVADTAIFAGVFWLISLSLVTGRP